jgi:hypothetical protein
MSKAGAQVQEAQELYQVGFYKEMSEKSRAVLIRFPIGCSQFSIEVFVFALSIRDLCICNFCEARSLGFGPGLLASNPRLLTCVVLTCLGLTKFQ